MLDSCLPFRRNRFSAIIGCNLLVLDFVMRDFLSVVTATTGDATTSAAPVPERVGDLASSEPTPTSTPPGTPSALDIRLKMMASLDSSPLEGICIARFLYVYRGGAMIGLNRLWYIIFNNQLISLSQTK